MLRISPLARQAVLPAFIVLTMLSLQPGVSQTVSVLTQHNDLSRSGANPNETILTTSNVNESSFGKLFTMPVDGFVYAQPLYDPNVAISGGMHNVIYVATAHDSVYAFDADSGTEYWRVSLGTPVPSSVINTQNILVEVGIISTPVIDPTSGTIYVTAKTYENKTQIFRLHALDITTGAEKFGGPVEIAATASGSGVEGNGSTVSFVASQENQRAAVSLINGVVYLAFASHEDHNPYHGWLLGYSPSTLQQEYVFNVTPNSGEGAIWMGGQGLLADASNNIYVVTANSTQSTDTASEDYGQSFLKLVPSGGTLTVADYFKPNEYNSWNGNDLDLGSTGAFAIPGTSYIAGGSKAGILFVINTDNMGKLDTSANQVVQQFQATNGLWGNPAFWNNNLYIWGVNEPLKMYHFTGSVFETTPTSQSAYSPPGGTTSGTVSVSSDGTNADTAIVWATAPAGDPDHATVAGNMYAYDATDLGTLLWSTSQNSSRDGYGNYAKFCAPTIANGKVYVGTDSERVVAYGILSSTSSFTLARSASALSVTQGASATDTITVTDVGGFTGSVTLAASGLPSGVTAAFATNPATSTSVLTLTASGTAVAGTSILTITGTSGTQTASTSISLTVSTTTTCTPTSITPYISVNGGTSWTKGSSATVSSTTTAVDLGPQPVTGGSWSWTGPNGFTSALRQVNGIPLSMGANVYVATYTNAQGCKSTGTFTVTVTGGTSTAITPYISVNGGSTWTEESTATVASTTTAVDLGPQPVSGGSWSWTGPNGFTSTSRQINHIPLSTGANAYVATYTNASSVKSTETFTITVQ